MWAHCQVCILFMHTHTGGFPFHVLFYHHRLTCCLRKKENSLQIQCERYGENDAIWTLIAMIPIPLLLVSKEDEWYTIEAFAGIIIICVCYKSVTPATDLVIKSVIVIDSINVHIF